MLKSAVAAGGAAILPALAAGQEFLPRAAWRTAVSDYLAGHARPDGGYAWEDQPHSHLTPTFAVIGCYHLLGQTPPVANEEYGTWFDMPGLSPISNAG